MKLFEKGPEEYDMICTKCGKEDILADRTRKYVVIADGSKIWYCDRHGVPTEADAVGQLRENIQEEYYRSEDGVADIEREIRQLGWPTEDYRLVIGYDYKPRLSGMPRVTRSDVSITDKMTAYRCSLTIQDIRRNAGEMLELMVHVLRSEGYTRDDVVLLFAYYMGTDPDWC